MVLLKLGLNGARALISKTICSIGNAKIIVNISKDSK